METIRNPIEWGADQIRLAAVAVELAGRALGHVEAETRLSPPAVARIGAGDLVEALWRGLQDFAALRTDVVFLCVAYPLAGLVLARVIFREGMVPLLFPLASGFALVGPFAAVGLYELSRRREEHDEGAPPDAWGVVRSPAFGRIALLGALMVAIFLLWLAVAEGLYLLTLGPHSPASVTAFAREVLTTGAGWRLIVAGIGVGFLFAVVSLAVGVVSFPLLLDRDLGIGTAIATSVRAVAANPGPMALWGAIVAGGLVIGSIPLFLGLVIVMPVLGHATWHLYRKLVPR